RARSLPRRRRARVPLGCASPQGSWGRDGSLEPERLPGVPPRTGKDGSRDMTQGGCFVGIDVSKAWLDACLWPQGEVRTFANDRAGLRDLVRWAERLEPEAVAFEASGGYERALIAALGEAGLPARRINPA